MTRTIRLGVLGLVGGCFVWSCHDETVPPHETATSSDADASGTDTGGSGQGSDDGLGDTGGSGGAGSGSVGDGDTTQGSDSGGASTTRGSGSRNDSVDSTTTGSGGGDASTTSGSSDDDTTGGSSDGSGGSVSNSAGGMPSVTNTTSGIATATSAGGSPTTSGTSATSVVTNTTIGSSTVTTTGSESDPEVPYLDDCDVRHGRDHVDDNYCMGRFECPAHSGNVECFPTSDGTISCDCWRPDDTGPFDLEYTLHGIPLDDACLYAASACSGYTEAEGPLQCTPSSQVGSTGCTATHGCEKEIDIDGADITRELPSGVRCGVQDEAWVCRCLAYRAPNTIYFDAPLSRSVTMDATAGVPDQCLAALDWCVGDEITREGERSCTGTTEYSDSNSCFVDFHCTQDAVASGVPATIIEDWTFSCEGSKSAGWVCECPGAPNIEVEAETAEDACDSGALQCVPQYLPPPP